MAMNKLSFYWLSFFLGIISLVSIGMGNGVSINPIGIEDVTINGVRAKGPVSNQKLKQLGTVIKTNYFDVEEGKFKNYFYEKFVLQTYYEEKEKCWIMDWFSIKSENFKTKRGIGIGDDLKKVMEQYGNKIIEQNVCIYESPDRDMVVQFEFKNDKVYKISLH